MSEIVEEKNINNLKQQKINSAALLFRIKSFLKKIPAIFYLKILPAFLPLLY